MIKPKPIGSTCVEAYNLFAMREKEGGFDFPRLPYIVRRKGELYKLKHLYSI